VGTTLWFFLERPDGALHRIPVTRYRAFFDGSAPLPASRAGATISTARLAACMASDSVFAVPVRARPNAKSYPATIPARSRSWIRQFWTNASAEWAASLASKRSAKQKSTPSSASNSIFRRAVASKNGGKSGKTASIEIR
jgi:hypothetical protein